MHQAVRVKFNLRSWLLSLYLGIAPVYWLPGVNPELLRAIKVGLFVLAVGSVFLHGLAVRGVVPRGLLGPMGFLVLLLFSTPGLIQAVDVSSMVELVMDIGFGAVFLWCFFNTGWRDDVDPSRVLARSLLILSVFAALTVANALTGLPDWESPYGHGLTEAGFGNKRTGWSNALGLYLPAILLLLGEGGGPLYRSLIRQICCLAILVCIAASQFLAGGRAGILLSLLTILGAVWLRPSFAILTISTLLLAAVAVLPEDWYIQLRLDRLAGGIQSLHDLDHFSAQRIGGYVMALELLKERLLAGYGIGKVLYETNNAQITEIHNLWLKWMVYCGILAPLLFLAMVVRMLRIALRNLRHATRRGDVSNAAVPSLVLFMGILLSLAEPNVLVGTFQTSAVWWAAAGTVMSLTLKCSGHEKHRQRLKF